MRSSTSPLAAVAKGVAAGVGGTVVMTAYQLAVAKLRDSGSSSAPGEVGRRIIEGVFEREVPEDRMDDLNNAMHALYGTSWGPVYGVAQSSLDLPVVHHGALFGTTSPMGSVSQQPSRCLTANACPAERCDD
ncbi:MAG: hypothetical protein WAL63_02060 [Solirubrobacteraceae bacterium]